MRGTVEYRRILPGTELPDLQQGKPFRAVIVLASDYKVEWQNAVSNWLIASGCRYAMAWGLHCERFHDSVDRANVDKFPGCEIPNDHFVMTTWHVSETLESVFWFAQFSAVTTFDVRPLRHTVIIDVSTVDRSQEMFDLYEQSFTLAEREPDDDAQLS